MEQEFKLTPRAEAYYNGKEQIVAALVQIANHLHTPPKDQRKTPDKIFAPDITKIRQIHRAVREVADACGIEIPSLEI